METVTITLYVFLRLPQGRPMGLPQGRPMGPLLERLFISTCCKCVDKEVGVHVLGEVCGGAAGRGSSLHQQLPEGTEGPQPAHPSKCSQGPLQYTSTHHSSRPHAVHQGIVHRHVSSGPEGCCACHSQAVQPGPGNEGRPHGDH